MPSPESAEETPETAEPVDLQPPAGDKPDSPANRIRKAKAAKKRSTLPRPRFFHSKDPAKLEDWIRSFTPEQASRAIIHWYREWPLIDRKLVGEQKSKLIHMSEGTLFEPTDDTPDLSTFILAEPNWGGSGEYKLIVTEAGVPGALAMLSFELQDSQYPPVVDPRTLVVGAPGNKGYLEGLRATGIQVPGDDPAAFRRQQEEATEMNFAQTAFETVNKQNERLTEKVEQLSEKLGGGDAQPVESIAEEMGREVFRSGLRMVEKQVDRVSASQATAYNPIEVAKASLELAKEMKGDTNGIIALMQGMFGSQTTFMAQLLEAQRQETAYWREQLQKRDREEREPKKDPIEELVRLKQISREFFGREPREREEPAAPAKNWLETLVENPAFPQVLQGGMQIVTTLLSLLRVPAAASPAAVPAAQPASGSTPEQLREALAHQPGAAEQQGSGAAKPAAVDAATEAARAAHLKFMDLIEKPFVAHFFDTVRDELNGYTFAYAMHCEFVHGGPPTENGRRNYLTIRDGWKQDFDQAIRNHLPIWSQVQGNIGKYKEFLGQFMTYDDFERQQRAQGDVTPIKAS
jgi:hypothetical protein